nr:hypothetical protein GCM10020063_042420 [Dactylosporangium thailandense]
MTGLLSAKSTRHPDVARILLDTGDARLLYVDAGSACWVDGAQGGTNWIGRLLEGVRSQLAAAQAGISGPPAQNDAGLVITRAGAATVSRCGRWRRWRASCRPG